MELKDLQCRKILQAVSTKGKPRPNLTATRGKCSDCQTDVWLAPSSVSLMKSDPSVVLLCDKCVAVDFKKNPGPIIPVFAPGAKEELLQQMKKVENN